jgi:tetratricopeptide (TPR) repeat protein
VRVLVFVLSLVVLAGTASAQRYKYTLKADTPEGQALQKAGQEEDEAKRMAAYEDFVSKNPKNEGAGYAYAQLVPLYSKAGQWDKVIDAAGKGLEFDPLNAPMAYNALQACEKKNDAECVKTWSARTADVAAKVVASPQPKEEDEVEDWKRDVDFSKQVTARAEYSLSAMSLQSTDPKVAVDLYETLEKRNPNSEYLAQATGHYLIALRQLNMNDKAAEVAEKALVKDPNNEDLLVLVANNYLSGAKKDSAKCVSYSEQLVKLMSTKAAPAGVPPADWEKKKNSLLGLGYWMQGRAYNDMSNWPQTDKQFKASLPYIQGNNDLLAPAYFFLGIANAKMAEGPKGDKTRLPEARKYTQMCVAMNSPYQAQAKKNLLAMGPGK